MATETADNMSFLDHLEELRWRLVRAAIAVLIVGIGIWIYQTWLIENLFLSMSKADFVTFRVMCDLFALEYDCCAL